MARVRGAGCAVAVTNWDGEGNGFALVAMKGWLAPVAKGGTRCTSGRGDVYAFCRPTQYFLPSLSLPSPPRPPWPHVSLLLTPLPPTPSPL
jgi:hypothetical protein